MSNKITYFVLTAASVVAIAFIARQRTLQSLHADNESLRQQIKAPATAPEPELEVESLSTNHVASLSPEERLELIRLRGQVQPLRGELQDVSNRLATLNQPSPRRAPMRVTEMPPELHSEMSAENEFKGSEPFTSAIGLASAMRKYLDAHGGELPDDITKVEALADPPLPKGVGQRFELMQADTLPAEGMPYALIAREKEARQLTDGKWVRIYLHANGGTSLAGPVEIPDWAAWERLQEAIGRATVRKKQREIQR